MYTFTPDSTRGVFLLEGEGSVTTGHLDAASLLSYDKTLFADVS